MTCIGIGPVSGLLPLLAAACPESSQRRAITITKGGIPVILLVERLSVAHIQRRVWVEYDWPTLFGIPFQFPELKRSPRRVIAVSTQIGAQSTSNWPPHTFYRKHSSGQYPPNQTLESCLPHDGWAVCRQHGSHSSSRVHDLQGMMRLFRERRAYMVAVLCAFLQL